MSGLRGLAEWALGGQPPNDDNDTTNNESAPDTAAQQQPLSPEEIRAQRLARLEAQQAKAALEKEQQVKKEKQQEPAQAMEVEEVQPKDNGPEDTDVQMTDAAATTTTNTATTTATSPNTRKTPKEASPAKKKKKKEDKAHRKKELLLQKVLQINLQGGLLVSNSSTSSSVMVEGDNVAEWIANRLLMGDFAPQHASLIAYLGHCYLKATEELKAMQSSTQQKQEQQQNTETTEMLQEIQSQVVSYAGSCLQLPDLFPAAKDSPQQLAHCLIQSAMDPAKSITMGSSNSNSNVPASFYARVCDELVTQHALEPVITEVAQCLLGQFKQCHSVLDGTAQGASPVVLVTALTTACTHKQAAAVVIALQQGTCSFLLPPEDSPQAAQIVRPVLPPGTNIMQQLLLPRPYTKRSGQGLEKETLLGIVMAIGAPKVNPAFTANQVLRQSQDAVTRANRSQRQQLVLYQDALQRFVMALIKAGGKEPVLQWFKDCLVVNVGAEAMNPDLAKLSSSTLLWNVTGSLLKLCEPVVRDASKHALIDTGFVSAGPQHNGGIFPTTGDHAVKRLGATNDNDTTNDNYNPKNTFIPQCFFLCARSLHLSICPQLRYYENVLRHINHTAWELRNAGRDMSSDPNFAALVARQRSLDVGLFEEGMIASVVQFANLLSSVLVQLDDDAVLRQMPEDFISDVCELLLNIAKFQGSLLRGVDCSAIFSMVVKFLSARYASMIRNYNLRARLGDVLYELYLPPASGERRDIPESVYAVPGGQTFLLSDAAARETLAPSLLLLYGEVEHTGHYDKMSHRAKIASLIKYLWESSEHRPAFRRITQNKASFIKFANGIMNETNTLIATVMQKLPEIRNAQEQMKKAEEWGRLSEEAQGEVTSRLEENEREVKHALPLCNKTVQMFGYLNTDPDIRNLFLLEELCQRLVNMLLHVLTKLVGSRGVELKVDNPENYDFKPKEMLRDLCAIFSLFASSESFQLECARAGCQPTLLRLALKTCRRLNLLTGESLSAFETLPESVEAALNRVQADESLVEGAPDEFLDEILSTFMKDPVKLPSGHVVDRSTITQHLLNDPTDPFSREPLTIDDIEPAVELKAQMTTWLEEKRAARQS